MCDGHGATVVWSHMASRLGVSPEIWKEKEIRSGSRFGVRKQQFKKQLQSRQCGSDIVDGGVCLGWCCSNYPHVMKMGKGKPLV